MANGSFKPRESYATFSIYIEQGISIWNAFLGVNLLCHMWANVWFRLGRAIMWLSNSMTLSTLQQMNLCSKQGCEGSHWFLPDMFAKCLTNLVATILETENCEYEPRNKPRVDKRKHTILFICICNIHLGGWRWQDKKKAKKDLNSRNRTNLSR